MSKVDELDNRVTALELAKIEQDEAPKKESIADSIERRVAELEKLVRTLRR